MITLKDEKWLERQRHAGRVVAEVLTNFHQTIKKEKNINCLNLAEKAEEIIASKNCTPTFKGYHGFPAPVCISVNKELVHGIPKDYVLKEGDIITMDLGATFEGAIADAAWTTVYGDFKDLKHKKMLDLCQGSLMQGINAIEEEKHLGIIGNTIFNYTKNSEFGLVIDYGGHGIDYNKPHAPPFVANKARSDEGPRIQKGFSIAIEPMLVLCKNTKTKKLKDKWTIVSKEISCHFEHSVTLDPKTGNKIIITEHNLENN